MRSAMVAESRTAAVSAVRELLVLWQHPVTRAIFPIGRFGFDAGTYTFVYTRAANRIEDFRPLPGLGDLSAMYRDAVLPAVFDQRVMDVSRPDFAEYVGALGLDPAHATPWEQIVSSGGSRVGDTLQFMQVPTVINGRAIARFLANGVRRIPGVRRSIGGRIVEVSSREHEATLASLAVGETVLAESEDDNPQDENAMLVTSDGVPLGYVPRVLTAGMRELAAESNVVPLSVVRIGRPGTASHLRLVLDLDVAALSGFTFDRTAEWEPVVREGR